MVVIFRACVHPHRSAKIHRMIKLVKRILLNRNAILVISVILGLVAGSRASRLQDYTYGFLVVTMLFSMTGIRFKFERHAWLYIKPMLAGIVFNYLLFAIVLLPLAWWLVPSKMLFYGFVVIAAAPPGVAIIPFSHILNGNVEYSILGVIGAFIGSVVLAPLLVNFFAPAGNVSPFYLFVMMVQLIIVPLVVSRLLLIKPIFKYVEPIRGKVVDWGFAVIIFVAVGSNSHVFFSNARLLAMVAAVLIIATFGLGICYGIIATRLGIDKSIQISQVMLIAIKSSGFSVFTAMSLFGSEAALPSAVLAVVVLLYLLFLSFRKEIAG